MLLYALFLLYVIALFIFVLFAGICHLRISAQLKGSHAIITQLFPVFITFILANSVFSSLPRLLTLLPGLLIFISKRLENVRIFGLTGGVAVGKTTLVKMILRNLKHMQIIDCESIWKYELKKGQNGYQKFINLFDEKSKQFLDLETKQIEKQKFIDFLYESQQNMKALQKNSESIVLFSVFKQILQNLLNKKNIMILNSPSLDQSKFMKYLCYPIVLIQCPYNLQMERTCKKWNCNQMEAAKRLQYERPSQIKMKNCQILINNSKSEQELLNEFLTRINPYMKKKMTYIKK